MSTSEPVGQQGRWLDLFGEYDITIQHRPGRVHGNSDALSRRPCECTSEENCRQCPKPPSMLTAVPITCDALSADGSTALPALICFPPYYSQPARSPDLLLNTDHADTTSDLLEAPVLPVSPSDATHASSSNNATAQANVFGVNLLLFTSINI